VEKLKKDRNGGEGYFMTLESETLRRDEEVLVDGTKALAQMVAIILMGGLTFSTTKGPWNRQENG
jgi:hypothetical protein